VGTAGDVTLSGATGNTATNGVRLNIAVTWRLALLQNGAIGGTPGQTWTMVGFTGQAVVNGSIVSSCRNGGSHYGARQPANIR
jgi:hypothetical protein